MWIRLHHSPESNAGEVTRSATASARQLKECQQEGILPLCRYHSKRLWHRRRRSNNSEKEELCHIRASSQDSGTYIAKSSITVEHSQHLEVIHLQKPCSRYPSQTKSCRRAEPVHLTFLRAYAAEPYAGPYHLPFLVKTRQCGNTEACRRPISIVQRLRRAIGKQV